MVEPIASSQLITPSIVNTAQQLSNSLKSIQPVNSEATQLITYTLIATAVVGILVYHYIKNQEQIN
jgi:hypothetical protein